MLLSKRYSVVFFLLAALLLVISSCAPRTYSGRAEQAIDIAQERNLVPETLDTTHYPIRSYKRLDDLSNKEITIYIEGDGSAYLNRTTPSKNPTPRNPVALKLAGLDPSHNVIYLARPCQFIQPAVNPEIICSSRMWTTHRYSQKVLDTYMELIDQIKTQYNIERFHLVGYSGGGVIAALLTVERDDIATLRTVAANLDVGAFTRYHNVDPMTDSLDSADRAAELFLVPQCHYVGLKDNVVTPSIVKSFLLKQSQSLNYVLGRLKTVEDAKHGKKWQKIWPVLIRKPLTADGICPA